MVRQQNSTPESEFKIQCIFMSSDEFSGWTQGRGLEVNRATFFSFVSYKIFEETMNEADLIDRLYTQHSPMSGHGIRERSGRLCLLIDEMQDLMGFEDADMQRGVEDFFRFVWNNSIPVVGTGTFELSRWNWADSLRPMAHATTQTHNPFRSPFNKSSFCQWPPFTFDEVNEILNIYDKRIEPIPDDLRPLIYREANGHAASIMALLRFVHEEHPTIGDWDVMLEAKYASHMNGFRLKINAEVEKREDVRNLLRSLLMHKDKPWGMDVDRPSDVEYRLLNTGIIVRAGTSSVRFTSSIIFRSCLDAVIPRRKSICMKVEDLQDPIHLLCIALRYTRPAQIMTPKVHIKHGPSENIFHLELYTALRDLVPLNWLCSPEVHETSGSNKRLDLLIAERPPQSDPRQKESYVNWAGYELKVNKVSRKDFDEPLDQCRGYTKQHRVGVYLVNFVNKHQIPELTGAVSKSSVTIVNVFYNDNYSHFTVKCDERIEEFDVVSDS